LPPSSERLADCLPHQSASLSALPHQARIAQLKDYTTICPPTPSEVLALIALRARPTLLTRSHALLAAGLEAARAVVGAHPEVRGPLIASLIRAPR